MRQLQHVLKKLNLVDFTFLIIKLEGLLHRTLTPVTEICQPTCVAPLTEPNFRKD